MLAMAEQFTLAPNLVARVTPFSQNGDFLSTKHIQPGYIHLRCLTIAFLQPAGYDDQ